jgi:hypothetical protein
MEREPDMGVRIRESSPSLVRLGRWVHDERTRLDPVVQESKGFVSGYFTQLDQNWEVGQLLSQASTAERGDLLVNLYHDRFPMVVVVFQGRRRPYRLNTVGKAGDPGKAVLTPLW